MCIIIFTDVFVLSLVVWIHVCLDVGVHLQRSKESDAPGLELRAVVTLLMWVLRTEPGSSCKALCVHAAELSPAACIITF